MQCMLVSPCGRPMPAVGGGGPAVPIGGMPLGGRNPKIVGKDKYTSR